MRHLRTMLLSWSDRLSMFASRLDDPETCAYRLQQAREQITRIKERYEDRGLSFDYLDETIHGEFVSAIEGDYPGTYMVLLRISSSRVCNGPCFLRLGGTRVKGMAMTGRDGLIGIAASASE